MYLISSLLWLSLWLGQSLCCSDININYPLDYGSELCEPGMPQFDYIVAGAGSAGCVVANRLSEESTSNVLLLERGKDPFDINSEIQILWTNTLKTDIDYNYISEPHECMFQGLKNGLSEISRGKVSGGSSSINAGYYTRGYRQDYDGWSEMGCDGWDYDSVLPYFLKSEDYHGDTSNSTAKHAKGGLVSVTPNYTPDPALKIFYDGFAEVGLSLIPDLNGEKNVGYGPTDLFVKNLKRCSAFKAFLSNTKSRENLFFARGSLVNKVIFDGNNAAIGVEVTAPSGKTCTVFSRKEVILSMGAIATPQILLLSGVGPKDHLKEMGIPVVADLPVGFNYHDHAIFNGLLFSDHRLGTQLEPEAQSEQLIKQTVNLAKEGSISTYGLNELFALYNTKHMDPKFHNIQIPVGRFPIRTFQLVRYNNNHILYSLFGYSEETAQLYTEYNNKADTILTPVILTDILSTGRIELKTLNAADPPKIHLNYLGDEKEEEAVLAGVRFIERLSQTEALKKANIELKFLDFENCRNHPRFSDEYYKCAFRQIVTGSFHCAGSVRMGAQDDEKAVLDPRLRVKGVCNLRVADASIMPKVVSINTNAGTIMIGEKVSDMIKEDSKVHAACIPKIPSYNMDRSRYQNTDWSRHQNTDESRHQNTDESRHQNTDEPRHQNTDESRHQNTDESRHQNTDESHQNTDGSHPQNADGELLKLNADGELLKVNANI